LAHSKSALKRWRQSIARRNRNRSIKSRTKTFLNKALVAIETDASTALEAVRNAVSALDRAAQKGVIHRNAAARGKSRLLKRYNLAVANAVAQAAQAKPEAEEGNASTKGGRGASETRPAGHGRSSAEPKPPARRTRKSS